MSMHETWSFKAHIPHGSGDAEWRVTAGSDLIAIVDPKMVIGDPESHARLIAQAPNLLRRLKEAAAWIEAELAGRLPVEPLLNAKAAIALAEDEDEDDGCPVGDPECLGSSEDCHDACERPNEMG